MMNARFGRLIERNLARRYRQSNAIENCVVIDPTIPFVV